MEGACFELGSATEVVDYEYNAYNGYAADASYYGAATSPCVLSDFKAALEYGQGYLYDPLGGVGWCKSIDRDYVANIGQAYEDGAWMGEAPAVTYLPIGNDNAADARFIHAHSLRILTALLFTRCNTTLKGLVPGKIDCRASQVDCFASGGWKENNPAACFTDDVGGTGTRLHCPVCTFVTW